MNFLKNITADPPPEPKRRKNIDGGFLFLLAVTLASGIAVLLLKGPARVVEICLETGAFIVALTPKIAAGTFIASALPLLMPRDKVAGWIGKDSGARGIALACLAGAVIPGGPMMIFPIAAGFIAAGADIGAIIAFVSSWNLLGLNRTLIWEFSFFAPDIVWLRWGLSLPMPFLLGLSARSFAYRFVR
jgi:uncharacterized membrane protein YraQ (UPF0718 family)